MITQEGSELLYTTLQKDCKYTQTFAQSRSIALIGKMVS